MRSSIAWTIFRKELTETLRDRKTLFMMVALPVLLYPLIMIGTGKLVDVRSEAVEERASQVAVWGEAPEELLELLAGWKGIEASHWREAPESLREDFRRGPVAPPVAAGQHATEETAGQDEDATHDDRGLVAAATEAIVSRRLDAVLAVGPGFGAAIAERRLGRASIYYDSVREDSVKARERLEKAMASWRGRLVERREREMGLPEGFAAAIDVTTRNVAPPSRRSGQFLGMILPVLVIVMSLLGGFYPAIDVTAGEKERGTMQTLLCAPLSPVEIIAGKMLAVWTISLLAALANLASLGLALARMVPSGQVEVAFTDLALAFVVLVPVTFLMSAVFLAVAVFARDFKDGQNYVTPVYMLIALPSAVTMVPGIELNAWTTFVPVVNIALLIKGLLIGEAAPELVFLTLISSVTYGVLAVLFASKVFEQEQLLLGGRGSVRALFGMERASAGSATPTLALASFGTVLVLTFYGSLLVERAGTIVTMLVVEYGFFLAPAIAVVLLFRLPVKETLSLRRPSPGAVAASIAIGASAWAAIAGLVVRLLPPPDSLVEALEKLFLVNGAPAPLWVVLLVLAVSPAVCEEVFFRGLVLSGMRRLGPWPAIIVTALLFGLAHASIYRVLPTALLGILFGILLWRTRSVFCAMVAHAVNNGLMVTAIHVPAFAGAIGISPEGAVSWRVTAAGALVLALGLALLWWATKADSGRAITASSS